MVLRYPDKLVCCLECADAEQKRTITKLSTTDTNIAISLAWAEVYWILRQALHWLW